MNYINPKEKKIIKALNNHLTELFPLIQNRVSTSTNESIRNFLSDDVLKKILNSKPKELEKINTSFYKSISNYSLRGYDIYKNNLNVNYKNLTTSQLKRNRTKYKTLHIELNRIFNYENSFSVKTTKYSTYNLAETLDISACTYCNRIYTKTVITPEKITRPEFDHWFPKGKYPLLALSFFNLIPSCHICNSSAKGDTDFSLITHIHPYVDKKINMQFSYKYDKGLSNHKFKLKFDGDNDNKAKTTAKEFKLEEIYETHEDELKDLLRIKNIYSDTYLEKLNGLLGSTVSYDEIYRLAFGTYIEESKFDKRPLSRMKRDILKELDIIKNEDDGK